MSGWYHHIFLFFFLFLYVIFNVCCFFIQRYSCARRSSPVKSLRSLVKVPEVPQEGNNFLTLKYFRDIMPILSIIYWHLLIYKRIWGNLLHVFGQQSIELNAVILMWYNLNITQQIIFSIFIYYTFVDLSLILQYFRRLREVANGRESWRFWLDRHPSGRWKCEKILIMEPSEYSTSVI